jgi:hypothetical protein
LGNRKKEDHTLKDSICKTLIGQKNYKPFFLFCSICSEVENPNSISIENHIRLKDPQTHKAKLLETLKKDNEVENKQY